MQSGQLVLMTLPDNSDKEKSFDSIPGVILSLLGKKKPQHYEVFALNEIWIATENDLSPLGKMHKTQQHSVSLN